MSRAYFTRAMVPGTRDERSQIVLPSSRARLELVRHYSMGMPAEQPQPAECSTEIGAEPDDADPETSAWVWSLYAAILVVALIAAASRFLP